MSNDIFYHYISRQAFIFKSKLPISDYINDMRSVVDQAPRLLAAMECIALEDKGSAGSFEMFSCFPMVRRIIGTGIMNPRSGLDKIVYPVTFEHVWVSKQIEKAFNHQVGRLEIGFKVDRSVVNDIQPKKSNADNSQPSSVTLVLGTLKGGYLLQTSSFSIPEYKREKFWTKSVGLDFDWNIAEANGDCVVLRVVHEFAHSIDLEMTISLKHPE